MAYTNSTTSTHQSNRKTHLKTGRRSGNKTDRRLLVGANLERCIFCNGTNIARAGKRYKQHEILQRWYCHSCAVSFSPRTAGKGGTYPLKVILETLCHFYQGYTIQRSADYIRRRFGLPVHPRTISRWLNEYRDLTTFARLRDKVCVQWPPHRLIRSTRLHHKQVYTYRIHHGKLDQITRGREHPAFHPVADYLTDMAENCPHHLFQASDNTGNRASQGKAAFNLDAVEIKAKRNHACRIADLVLQTVTNNKRRHDEIQRFMLITDSVTVAGRSADYPHAGGHRPYATPARLLYPDRDRHNSHRPYRCAPDPKRPSPHP